MADLQNVRVLGDLLLGWNLYALAQYYGSHPLTIGAQDCWLWLRNNRRKVICIFTFTGSAQAGALFFIQ